MARENVVEIVVKATDDTAAGFGASKDSAAASADMRSRRRRTG